MYIATAIVTQYTNASYAICITYVQQVMEKSPVYRHIYVRAKVFAVYMIHELYKRDHSDLSVFMLLLVYYTPQMSIKGEISGSQ